MSETQGENTSCRTTSGRRSTSTWQSVGAKDEPIQLDPRNEQATRSANHAGLCDFHSPKRGPLLLFAPGR